MVSWFAGICNSVTDLVVGSKLRTKFEALAVELEEQDYQFYVALQKAIPVSIYQAFSFPLLAPVKAFGLVTFSANPAPTGNLYIPEGTKIGTSGTPSREFVTTEPVIIPAGQTSVNANVACTIAGISGNVGAGTIVVIKTSIPRVTAVTNAAALLTGKDREKEEERRQRFQDYITTLSRGTDAAIQYGATTAALASGSEVVERVVSAQVNTTAAATVSCVVYNGSTGASPELIQEATKIIDGYISESGEYVAGYKAAGVVVTVTAATVTTIPVTVSITSLVPLATMQGIAEESILQYFSTLSVGADFISAEIVAIIMSISGVTNCEVTAPAGDTLAGAGEVFAAGAITVTG
jgi:uncharacterized phage protein gp47/JayE